MVWQIEERVQNEVKRGEIHVVRALKESGPAVFDYIGKDAVFAIDGQVLDEKSEPSLREYMENYYVPHATFEMQDVKVIPTGLMAATVCYKAKATKIVDENKPPKKYTLVCSSSWRQLASADWELVSHCEGRA